MALTKKTNIVIPEVMGDAIDAKVEAMLKITPFAKLDTSLQGVPGDTKTVPAWNYIGDAEDVAEGEAVTASAMTCGTKEFTIKKAMKQVRITEESVNSGLGDPIGQAEKQLAKAIAGKVDTDVLEAVLTSTIISGDGSTKIGYAGIVDGVTLFDEEVVTDKVMFVSPEQVGTLRKDADFLSADKYNNNVMMTGEIGMVANTRIIPSKKIVAVDGIYTCPIIKLEPASNDTEYTEDELAAVTIFLKEDIRTDADWVADDQTHKITVAKYYGVALTNEAKVVLCKFKK